MEKAPTRASVGKASLKRGPLTEEPVLHGCRLRSGRKRQCKIPDAAKLGWSGNKAEHWIWIARSKGKVTQRL